MFGSMFSPKKRPVVIRINKNGDPTIVGRVQEKYLKELLYGGYVNHARLTLATGEDVNGFECVRPCELGIPDAADISLIIHKGDFILSHEDAVENAK